MCDLDRQTAINWVDPHVCTRDQLILTHNELPIPGLRTFGWQDLKCASPALRPHYHKDCIELTFVLEGSIQFFAGGRNYDIFGGDAFLTQPNAVHSTNELPFSVGEILWVQLDTSRADRFLFLQEEAAAPLIAALHDAGQCHIRTDNNAPKRAVQALVKAVRHDPQALDVYKVAAFLVFFLYQLLPFIGRTMNRVSPDIQAVCAYIHNNLRAELTLEDLAQHGGLSVSQFKYKFKAQVGISPRSYINQMKIEQIKSRIVPGVSFTDLASEYCFCNSAYFSAVFKKYAGMTPSEYLAANREHPSSAE